MQAITPISILVVGHSTILLWMRLASAFLIYLRFASLTFAYHSVVTKWYNNYKRSETLWIRGWTDAYEEETSTHARLWML